MLHIQWPAIYPATARPACVCAQDYLCLILSASLEFTIQYFVLITAKVFIKYMVGDAYATGDNTDNDMRYDLLASASIKCTVEFCVILGIFWRMRYSFHDNIL